MFSSLFNPDSDPTCCWTYPDPRALGTGNRVILIGTVQICKYEACLQTSGSKEENTMGRLL